jgi:transcriptional regulator with XRE-family HTH domain
MTPRQSKATTAANQRLVELVRAAFDASPMNRAELAEQSGIPDGSLGNILTGRRPIYAEQMVALADALGVPLQEWLDEMRAARNHAEKTDGVEP